MSNNTVTVTGGDEIIRALQKLGVEATDALFDALMDSSELMRADAEKRASDIGRSVSDNVVKVPNVVNGEGVVKIGLSEKGRIGIIFEMGAAPHPIEPDEAKALHYEGEYAAKSDHPGVAKQPFLRPAFDSKSDDVVNAFGELLKKKLGLS